MMFDDRTRSVLIVEDERIVAKDLQETLRGMGYDAYAIAASGDEAVSRVAERFPDLVLMDIRIKGQRDGIETAVALRERHDLPIIYLTAHADDATIARAKATAPYGYLLKPVKPAELRSAIEVSLFRHEMERRLREREHWFATTLRSIGDAVVTVDLGGFITFMNPVAEALTGVAARDALGRRATEILRLVDTSGEAQLETPLDHALRESRPSLLAEATLLTRDDRQRVIADTARPVIDDGQLLGAVMVFRDITDEKAAQRQLLIADRLASLGTMAASVAHEVNTPLAAVVANAQFVLDELAVMSDERLREAAAAVSEIASAGKRIGRIIADLKAFSRPEGQSAAAAIPSVATPPAPAKHGGERRGRILVIDDEVIMHRAMVRMLRGHDVVCTHGAHDALALLARGERFDVILTDVMMPGMTGNDLYEEVRRAYPEVAPRVVFVTGGATMPRIQEFLKTVPNLVVEKPFGAPELRRTIEELLTRGQVA